MASDFAPLDTNNVPHRAALSPTYSPGRCLRDVRSQPRGTIMIGMLKALPLPVTLAILSFVMPTEFSLFLGSVRLPPHRVVLLIFIVPALIRLIRSPDIRLNHFDVLFLLYAAWTATTYCLNDGLGEGFQYGASLAIESFGGYLIARAYVRDLATLRAVFALLFVIMGLVSTVALAEALSGQILVHDALHKLTGYHYPVGIEKRAGLTRAYVTFDHPILYGAFCASLFAPVWCLYRDAFGRGWRSGSVAGAAFLGLSAAPLLTIGVQAIIIGLERITRGIEARLKMLFGGLGVLYLLIEVLSTRPAIEAIATRITFDPWTAYYRVQIWTFGLENVARSPWTGIGLAEWERPDWMASASVDAYWLVVMMRSGIPALLLLLLAIGLLMRSANQAARPFRGSDEARLVFAWTTSLVALGLAGLTVHYWNAILAYSFFFLGLGGWFTDALKPVAAAPADAANAPAMAPRRRAKPLGGRFAQPV